MTLDDLQVLVRDQATFRKAFRKTDSDTVRGRELDADGKVQSAGSKNEMIALLKGNFRLGRMPNIHQATLPDGSQIRLKFYNVIKQILNSKGKEVPGKESFLSYLEVTVAASGLKAYCFTVDVEQVVWKTSRTNAQVKHDKKLNDLIAQADELGIVLSAPGAWTKIYSETY